MIQKTYILFTAGRGPIECTIAVKGVQAQFKKYLQTQAIDFNVKAQETGAVSKSISSIIFEVDTAEQHLLSPWLGTIQWICKSPIRRYHKRKNWYLKCVKIEMDNNTVLRKEDVFVQYFRASGPGGQHRNKVETGVRLTDSQTGIVVAATKSRSQSHNKKEAWLRLEKAVKRMQRQQDSSLDFAKWSEQIEIERGNPVKTFEGLKFIERK